MSNDNTEADNEKFCESDLKKQFEKDHRHNGFKDID